MHVSAQLHSCPCGLKARCLGSGDTLLARGDVSHCHLLQMKRLASLALHAIVARRLELAQQLTMPESDNVAQTSELSALIGTVLKLTGGCTCTIRAACLAFDRPKACT
eukprot:scaffold640290_cov36-Prasinocladus_malaysianus.AAC.1